MDDRGHLGLKSGKTSVNLQETGISTSPTIATEKPLSLVAKDITCVRGGRTVLEGMSFAVQAGEALMLRGPNGTGKSSLLRLLAGYVPVADGSLLWGGEDAHDDLEAYQPNLHYLGHLDAIKPVLSVRENISQWAALMGEEADADDALAHFGLAKLAALPAKYLSAGQKRRLNLARLAASHRPIWLLDEPSVSLDAESVAQLEKLVANHLAEGGMAIIATHLDLEIGPASVLRLGGGEAS
jgi:heme exporter protein A